MAIAFFNISFSSSSLAIFFSIASYSAVVTVSLLFIFTGLAFLTQPAIVDFDMPYSLLNSPRDL